METAQSSIRTSKPRLLLLDTPENKFTLSESPVWNEDAQRLHWVSQEGKTGVHTYEPATGEHFSVPTPVMTPAVTITTQKHMLIACLEEKIVVVDLDNRQIKDVLAKVPPELGCHTDSWRFNDSRATPGQQLMCGRMNQDHWEEGDGGWVLMLDRQGSPTDEKPHLSVLFEKNRFTLPNGFCWNLDKKTCYFNDTYAGTVNAIPCDSSTGLPDTTAEWRTVVKLDPDSEGSPDGLAIDKDGNLWVAHEKGSQVGVYDAESGKKLHKVEMPVKRVSACIFGGPDLTQLFITTIQEEGEEDSGKLFVVDVEGTGGLRGVHKYKL